MTLEQSLQDKKVEFKFDRYTGKTHGDYLAWVSDWILKYNELTKEIRYYKHRRKSKIYGTAVSDLATYRCKTLRGYAFRALDYRQMGKEEAQKQFMSKVEESV